MGWYPTICCNRTHFHGSLSVQLRQWVVGCFRRRARSKQQEISAENPPHTKCVLCSSRNVHERTPLYVAHGEDKAYYVPMGLGHKLIPSLERCAGVHCVCTVCVFECAVWQVGLCDYHTHAPPSAHLHTHSMPIEGKIPPIQTLLTRLFSLLFPLGLHTHSSQYNMPSEHVCFCMVVLHIV